MDSRLILHIGANKTGSSAVQEFLRLNVAALRKLNYIVPDRELGTSDRVTGEHVFALSGDVRQIQPLRSGVNPSGADVLRRQSRLDIS